MLQLSQATPIATGKHRQVYQHPDQPGQLVKVIRTDLIENAAAAARWPRTGPYRGYVREFKEYLASRHADTGLFSTVVANGTRHVDERLLAEFELQRQLFNEMEAEQKPARRRAAGGSF